MLTSICWSVLFSFVGVLAGASSTQSLPAEPVSHKAEVQARGHLTMLAFPTQTSNWVRPKVAVLLESGLTLAELHDPEAYEGKDLELIRGFAESLGVELRIQAITTNYGDLVRAVADGRGDLAASSVTITPERQKIVAFSDPVASMWAVVAGPLDSTVSKLEDLAGKRVQGMKGSSQVDEFRRVAPKDVELLYGDYTLENYAAVLEGNADFLLKDSSAEVGDPDVEPYPEVRVLIRLDEAHFGIVFPKGSDLCLHFNRYLRQVGSSDPSRS
ncbi:MAG: amino acid ABC transporter substrate-binding protein [bacterium]|nr:amino acid ABC transporter substrate-binding protein [bacterium]